MLTAYALNDGRLEKLDVPDGGPIPERAVWIDLHSPTPAQSAAAIALTHIDIPTEADLDVLSDTDRLYRQGGALYLEFTVLHRSQPGVTPDTTDLAAIFSGERLITVRYADPFPITRFAAAHERVSCVSASSMGIFVGLLENFVARIGEYVGANSSELYAISREVFHRKVDQFGAAQLQSVLDRLGRAGDTNAKARDCLASINRLLAFSTDELESVTDKPTRNAFRAIRRDVMAITDYANFVAGQLTFVLDAVLGLATVEQNRVIKIFSVVATLFIPPTLFASLWGMNFKHMPELDWTWGYPIALLTMLLSALLPYLYFRWRGWL